MFVYEFVREEQEKKKKMELLRRSSGDGPMGVHLVLERGYVTAIGHRPGAEYLRAEAE